MRSLSAFFLALCLSCALGTPINFLPTKTGGTPREFFWFQNDNGQVVPALLHGKSEAPSRAISDDVHFYLYNNKAIGNYIEIFPGCWACLNSFLKNTKTVFLAHGFSSDSFGGFGSGLRNNFAQAEETMNLIFIDWSRLAAAPWYETAAQNTRPVGQYTGQMIDFLVNNDYISIGDVVYAGHSLGSHIANYIAHNISATLPIIHALDPALPLFGQVGDEERIDPSDALFVNVIHTAVGTLWDGGLAFTEPRGHVDFYPNGGKNQPGCEGESFGACSHSRAHEFFGESIHRRTAFSACKCASWEVLTGCDCNQPQVMGWATPTSARGYYYLMTNSEPPFGIGN